jgi:uncharacterized membrane protein
MDRTSRHSDAELGPTQSGLEPTVAGALCYLLGFVTGILFFIAEKNNAFIRFHALQSILFFGGLFVCMMFFGLIPILGFVVNFLLGLCAFVVWLFLMVKAAQGFAFKLPILGDIAERNI